jgi:AcrR family transcriptional regulator
MSLFGRSPKAIDQETAGWGIDVGSQTAAGRGQETRERLLHAAVQLIVEVGWGEVSTRTVALRAGVPAGAVHYHFSSLAALLRSAVVPAMRALAGELTSELAAAPDVPAGIRRQLDAVVGQSANPADTVLVGEVFQQASRDEMLRVEVAAVLADVRAELARWLAGHGYGERAVPVATVLTAALDALGMHRALDPHLDLTGVEAALLDLVNGASR